MERTQRVKAFAVHFADGKAVFRVQRVKRYRFAVVFRAFYQGGVDLAAVGAVWA